MTTFSPSAHPDALMPLTRALVCLGGQLHTILGHMEEAQRVRPGATKEPVPAVLGRVLRTALAPAMSDRTPEELTRLTEALTVIGESIDREIDLMPASANLRLRLIRNANAGH